MIEEIAIETVSILILCTFILFSQIYITKILLKNVNARITQLDSNLAEAINSVIESKMGENFEAPNPLVGIITEMMKNNLNKANIPRTEDGKFKIIEEIK
tara:strand:+ start:161 stop:460 length:300 start_codon:yes stop_codon:yes gene_type:complete